MFKKFLSRSITATLIMAAVLGTSASLQANMASVQSGNKIFLGLGPVFGNGTVGYAQLGNSYEFARFDSVALSAGPLVALGFAKSIFVADFNAFIKVQYDFSFGKNYSLGLYARMPAGFTLASIISNLGLGFNLGLVPGAEFYFNRHFGAFMELGFIHHSIFLPKITGYSSHWPAGTFNAGLTYKF